MRGRAQAAAQRCRPQRYGAGRFSVLRAGCGRCGRAARSRGGEVAVDETGLWSFDSPPITMGGMLEANIDLEELPELPEQVSPPDHWQDRPACYGLDPEILFPATERDAGLALSYWRV